MSRYGDEISRAKHDQAARAIKTSLPLFLFFLYPFHPPPRLCTKRRGIAATDTPPALVDGANDDKDLDDMDDKADGRVLGV